MRVLLFCLGMLQGDPARAVTNAVAA